MREAIERMARPKQRAGTSIWLFSGITLLAMWILVGAAVVSLRETALEKARGDASNLSAAFEEQVHNVMAYVDGSMNLLQERLKVEGRGFDLRKWAPAIPEIAAATIQVAIIGPDGRLVVTTADPNAKPIDLSDREHIRVHLDNPNLGTFVGKPVVGRVTHKVTIQITKRLTWADGSFAGILLFSVDPRLLTSLHEKIDLGDSGVITLLGTDGVIRGRFTKSGGNAADPHIGNKIPRLFITAASGDLGAFEHTSAVDQIDRLYSWRRVEGYPLLVLVGLGRAEALATAERHAGIIIVVACLLTLVLCQISVRLNAETRRRAKNEATLSAERSRLASAVADLAAERERLFYSQEHLARAQRISGIGSIEVDIPRQRLEWSAGACALFGIAPTDVEPSKEFLSSFIHPLDVEAVHRARAAMYQTDVATPAAEYRIVRADNAVRWVYRENDLICDDEGRPVRRIITYRDITEARAALEQQEELKRQLMHSQKLEALGTLAGGVAHDLNNTLVPIMALSDMMLGETPADHPLRDDLVTILHASERARDLVKQILAFSRKQDLIRREVDPAAIVHEALHMLRASIPSTIRLDENIGTVAPLFADGGELQQVIVNLVTNAAQAIGTNKGMITVSLLMAGGTVCLRVADSGCGMDSATADRIFEPFFTTKPVGEGTGLGLSVVHGIVAGHGGRMEVKSTPGQGTIFTVFLPVDPAAMPVLTEAA